MFIGEYTHALDSKGRLIIPVTFRENLGEKFVATRGLDRCIFVYPQNEWYILQEKLKSLPITRKEARIFTRFFFSGATECGVDKQGRISIPQNLRRYAQLEKETVIIGVSNRVEIWSNENWDLFLEDALNKDDELAETIQELNI